MESEKMDADNLLFWILITVSNKRSHNIYLAYVCPILLQQSIKLNGQ